MLSLDKHLKFEPPQNKIMGHKTEKFLTPNFSTFVKITQWIMLLFPRHIQARCYVCKTITVFGFQGSSSVILYRSYFTLGDLVPFFRPDFRSRQKSEIKINKKMQQNLSGIQISSGIQICKIGSKNGNQMVLAYSSSPYLSGVKN